MGVKNPHFWGFIGVWGVQPIKTKVTALDFAIVWPFSFMTVWWNLVFRERFDTQIKGRIIWQPRGLVQCPMGWLDAHRVHLKFVWYLFDDVSLIKDLCKVDCAAFDIFPNSILWEVSKSQSNHLSTFKRDDFSQNLEDIGKKKLPRP